MRLSDAALEAVRLAVTDVLTRPLTPEEVFDEVVRLVREAQTPEQIYAVGTLIGRVTWLGKQFPRGEAVAVGGQPTEPGPGPAAPAVTVSIEPDARDAAAAVAVEEQVA